MTPGHEDELTRSRSAYDARDSDAAIADAYSPLGPGMLCLLQQRERALVRGLRRVGVHSLSNSRILEVGCGDGNVLAAFQRLGASATALTGVDLSESRIAAARAGHPAFALEVGSASDLPYPSKTFDITVQFTLLSSVFDPQLRASIASEMMRVTRPGGLLVSYELRPLPFALRLVRALVERGKRLFGQPALGARREEPAEERRAVSEPAYAEIVPLSHTEIAAIFPGVRWIRVPANLTLEMCSYAGPFRAFASDLLSLIPGLRVHELMIGIVEGDAQ